MTRNSGSAYELMRTLSLDIARVTETAAVAAAKFRGRGDERVADIAAAEGMRHELGELPVSGQVVIGEGEAGEVPMLYTGEEIGKGGSEVDLAVDPLEGRLSAQNRCRAPFRFLPWPSAADFFARPTCTWKRSRSGRGTRRGS